MKFGRAIQAVTFTIVVAQCVACATRRIPSPAEAVWSRCEGALASLEGRSIVAVWKDGTRAGYTLLGASTGELTVRSSSGTALALSRSALKGVYCGPANDVVFFRSLEAQRGNRVEVELLDGSRHRGVVGAVTPMTLTLRADRDPNDFASARKRQRQQDPELSRLDIRRVRRFDADGPWQGLAIGAGTGLGLELLTHDDGPEGLARHMVLAGAVFGSIGLLLDYGIQGSTVVYETVPK